MTYSCIIDSRGRVAMLRELRRQLGLSAGDRVLFVVEGERVVLRRLNPAVTDVPKKHKRGARRAF